MLILKEVCQKVLGCLVRLGHHYLFHRVLSFSAVSLPERVNEVAPSLCLVCSGRASPNEQWSSVIQRMQSPLTVLLLALSLPFPFVPSPLARSSHCRSDLAISHFEKKSTLDFASRDVFGPSTSICNSLMSCRQQWSLEHKLATSISVLWTFQHASETDPPICCQQVCP